jgi:hypothetical protein
MTPRFPVNTGDAVKEHGIWKLFLRQLLHKLRDFLAHLKSENSKWGVWRKAPPKEQSMVLRGSNPNRRVGNMRSLPEKPVAGRIPPALPEEEFQATGVAVRGIAAKHGTALATPEAMGDEGRPDASGGGFGSNRPLAAIARPLSFRIRCGRGRRGRKRARDRGCIRGCRCAGARERGRFRARRAPCSRSRRCLRARS